jgi:O-antigen/teichoic acid export membrane protein
VYGFVFADKIIVIIYGTSYTAAITALQTLIFVVPIIFITSLFGNILGAINRQRILTIVAVINVLLNVTLNLILIQKFSYIGASAATVATECLGFILMFVYISRYFFKISVTQNILKTTFSSILVLIFIYYLKINTNWIISAILGLFVYLSLLYVMRIVTKEDVEISKGIL